MKSGSAEQCVSHLIAHEEADLVISLLGNKCQTLAMAVIQLFVTDPPYHSSWRKHDTGVLCLVKDHLRRSYFLRLYCINRRQMIWEHEVYNSLEYFSPKPFLHTFEGEDAMVAFSFANEEEARQLRNVLLEKLEAMKKRLERRNQQSGSNYYQHYHPPVSSVTSTDNTLSNGMIPPSKQKAHAVTSGGKRKEKDSKRKLTKADIGLPLNFRHVSHVGWDPNKGFDVDNVEDPQLRQFFEKAGVSDSQLQDRETREFIYDFINRHGGLDAVKNELVVPPHMPLSTVPPPVPARSTTGSTNYQTRSAPPPPPPPPSRSGHPPPLPTQPPATNLHQLPPPPPPSLPLTSASTTPTKASHNVSSPSVPAVPSVGAPPPPPPPPNIPVPPPPAVPNTTPVPSSGSGNLPTVPDARLALMESIRSGKQLKHVEVEAKSSTGGVNRGDLLDQIRQGVELKAVQPLPRPSQSSTPQNGLAGALARALAERSRVIHSDSSGSSGEDNEDEDEWED